MASAAPLADRIAPRIAGFFLTAVILLYLGFIGIGNWTNDEYDDFSRLAHEGWRAVWPRLQWSPRPLSEPLFLAYGWIVNHARRPLIIPFLGLLWAGFLAAGLLTWWQSHRARNREDAQTESIALELLAGLALMASFVSSGPITEVFYWPAGAAAYLPTLAATLLLFLQIARGRLAARSGRLLCSLCLFVAASSSEAGATFVLSYALVQVLRLAINAINIRSDKPPDPVLWWLIPSALAVLVLVAVQFNRFHAVERPVSQLSPALGHPLLSLTTSLRELLLESLGVQRGSQAGHSVRGRLLSQMLLATGLAVCWSRFGRFSRTIARQTATLSVAFVLASLLTIAAAELHFGALCCTRHETLRRCWMLMALAGLAIMIVVSVAEKRLRPRSVLTLASALLCAGVIVPWHAKAVLREYRIYGAIYYAMDQNFRSGFDPDHSQMTFLLLPPGGLIYQEQVTPGVYTRGPQSPMYVQFVLGFFDKESMVVHSADEWMDHRERRPAVNPLVSVIRIALSNPPGHSSCN